jgi:hypothetical protein
MPPRWARVSPEYRDRLSLSGGMCIEDCDYGDVPAREQVRGRVMAIADAALGAASGLDQRR